MKRFISIAFAAIITLTCCLSLASCTTTSTTAPEMTDFVYIKEMGETVVGFLSDSAKSTSDKEFASKMFTAIGGNVDVTIAVREYSLSSGDITEALAQKKVDCVVTVADSFEIGENVEKSNTYSIDGTDYVVLLRKGSDLTERVNNYLANHASEIESIYGQTSDN